ncbi:Ig-like domain-containing protein [Colwellia sp. RE-S-Sl-9]
MKRNYISQLIIASSLGFTVSSIAVESVKVDINLDIKHEVRGVSDFNRKKHITVHAALTEGDWKGEADTMNYLMNDLDVYFGRDNGMASWIFKATGQDPNNLGKPDIADLKNFGQWHKDNMYDNLPESIRAYESRSNEMIMGITPHGPFPTQSYWPNDLAGKDDEAGKYVLRHIADGAEWVGEYLDQFFRKNGESSGVLMPKYWEVINEPDMDINVGRTFVMSSFEQLFEYHNLVAEEIKKKLPEGQRPLVGGMTWGLHDLEQGDLSERFPTQERAVRSRYAFEEGDLEDFLQSITSSNYWATQDEKYFQWDAIWKGFMDASGENMDFYSIHLYDWAQMGDNPRQGSTFRRGMKTEAILDMVEWYDAQVNGKENLKPWVISEYGAIASKHAKLEFIGNDYRYADWLHLRTFNQMFMQILTRPSQVLKSMPFSPIKGAWGLLTGPNGEAIRYEASLMQTDEALAENYDNADWYVTDKIQWYELWSDVKGTRVDTHSSDPDVQVDAYVDGNHTYLILNNLEWYNIPVDLSFMGNNSNSVKSVNMKHSYLAEGLSAVNLGRPVLAKATLDGLPESVTLEPGSTIILDIEYNQNVSITSTMVEEKYYGESLAGAGKGAAAKGQIHRITGTSMTGNINDVPVPTNGEATLRIAAEFYPFHASKPTNNSFTINGHTLDVPTQINPNASGVMTEHFDYMGPEVDEGSVSLNLIEIPVPLEYLSEDNVITANVASARAFTAISLSLWTTDKNLNRTTPESCDPCTIATDLTISGESNVFIKETIALTANILPIDAQSKTVNWTSSNVNIVAVDQNGLATGTGAGTTTITATTAEGVLIAEHEVTVVTIELSSVDISEESADLGLNETLQLNVSVAPFNATNKKVTWSSSNDAVATVSTNGLITAVGTGNAIIKAEAVGGGASDTVSVNVTSVAVEAVDLPSIGVIVLPGSYQANVSFTPNNATDLSVNWKSANAGIASVDTSGLISGVSAGATTVTVTSNDGSHEDSIIVNVIDEIDVTATPVEIEAETMSNTGGAFAGFVASDEGINTNQTGDWAEFEVEFEQAGVYRFILDAGTPTASGTGVEVFINGVSSGSADIPSTTSWDIMQSTIVTNNLLVPTVGTHTIRIQSIGEEGLWQWNADKIAFVLLSGLNPALDPDGEPTDPTDPSDPSDPATPSLTLDDAAKYLSTTYYVDGTLDVAANFQAGTGHSVEGELNGVKFFLREMDASWAVVKDTLAFDATTVGKQSGTATAKISLAGLTPTADLPTGNFYFLFAAFKSSDGITYKIGGVQPITIKAEATPVEASLTLDDDNKYLTTTYTTGGTLPVTANFEAGSGQTVAADLNGVKFFLREMDASWTLVKDVLAYDGTAIGKQSGVASANISLVDVLPSAELPSGNFYFLYAAFQSTDGTLYKIGGVQPINILAVDEPTEPEEPVDNGEPGVTVDDVNQYISTVYPKGGILTLTAKFEAGANNTVVSSSFAGVTGGIQFILQELRENGSQVKRVVVGESSSIGQQNGWLTVDIPLVHPTQGDLKASDELNAGHYYNLTARFKSSNGSTQFLSNLSPITISANVEVLGDMDNDSDVDTLDVRLFTTMARNNEITDLRYDFNNDGVVNTRDVRGITALCTRSRCSIN